MTIDLDTAFFDYDDGVVTVRPSSQEKWSAAEAAAVIQRIHPNPPITSALQALITGALIGMLKELHPTLNIDIDVPSDDEHSDPRSWFDIVGIRSGTRVRVMVVTIE